MQKFALMYYYSLKEILLRNMTGELKTLKLEVLHAKSCYGNVNDPSNYFIVKIIT